MERLLFLHIGKTGGSSVGKWLKFDGDSNIYNYNASNCHHGSDSVRASAFAAKVIHVHGAAKGFKSNFNEEQWQSFLSDTARFCVIRDPIAKFESDFRYAIQASSGQQIPYVPGFKVESIDPLKASSIDYFSQSDFCRLGINEWVELMHDCYRLSSGGFVTGSAGYFDSRYADALSEFELKQDSPYLDLGILQDQFQSMRVWFGVLPEAQYSEIKVHLGKDFLVEPRYQEGFDILVTSELLDNFFAMLVIRLKWFRAFSIFCDKTLHLSDYYAVVSYLAGARINVTDDRLREKFRLNPRSRILFYEMSQKSYAVWTSATRHCAQQLQRLLS